jgi:UDP-N-acetylmuramyl pentapeptide phosphotransferase/UDP-N-acetylglucosamine-1-phosphate transferase
MTMMKWLVTLLVVLFALGLLRPVLTKLGLGRLPGDLEVRHRGRKFYFPLATSVIFSLVIALLLWLT